MRAVIAVTVVLVFTAGCADPGWLEVSIEARDLSDEMIDELEVQMIASRTAATEAEEAEICQPGSQIITDPEFPLSLVFIQGAEDWSCVALRVLGRRGGEQVIRAEELFCPSFDETAHATVQLHGACHSDRFPQNCAGHRVCRGDGDDASCQASSVGSLFELEPDTGLLCFDVH